MTVPALPNYITFAGNGTTGPFSFSFPFPQNSDLTASVIDSSGSITSAQIASITGAGSDTGGSVTLVTALIVGSTLTVYRSLPVQQQTQLPNGGPYFAATVEAALDYLTMLVQQLQTTVAITPKAVTSPSTTTFVNADASAGGGSAGIDGGIIGASVQYAGSGQLTVIKNDSTQYLVAVLPPTGKLICGRAEYDLSIGGESASFYPDIAGNLNRVG